ncbi:hypothetical protein AB0C52_05345 [Streptomyces sp. NPDC048717]|uniref:hypothetical protein n=1 Tax=Streptomyces sp. NPDC048717 TaxID=3154928 RepID=UPI0034438818
MSTVSSSTTLMIEAGPAAPDAPVTRTGGVPLAPAGTVWPHCASCEGPMTFLAEVFPEDADGSGAGRAVLALFACRNDPGMCEDWDPYAGGNRALLFARDGLAPLPVPEAAGGADGEGAFTLGAVRTVALERVPGADYDQARAAWTGDEEEGNGEGAGKPAVLGQLGGNPAWIQGDETPTCPACARPMPLAVQLEEGPDHRTSMNFGGGGCGYAFACEPCGQALFLWQC